MARLLVTALVASTLGLIAGAAPAMADTAEADPLLPQTVSADALPTVQINGVVWDQVVVGNRVYVTGSFTQARPAGAAPNTNQTPRSNILAFNIQTGQLITTWAPTLNAQGLAIEASADGSRIYVGGDFTSVSNVARSRVVALDATTGAVIQGFNAGTVNSRVAALEIVGNTLYFGGYFTAAGGQPRSRLASVNATTGALNLGWAPSTDREVVSMTSYPAGNRVIVGGSFYTLNGVVQWGMGSVDGTTGALQPWAANQTIQNRGADTYISDLTTDGESIYGVGWAWFGNGATANFEGQFSADPLTGELNWINGCRGDNYGIEVIGEVLYTAGHAHDCEMIGGNPQYSPDQWQRGQAFYKRGSPYGRVNAAGPFGNWQPFDGLPSTEILHWIPTISAGTYTGAFQGGYTVEGNSDYLVMGGEFPAVNGTSQQGLVRFARRGLAPNNNAIQGYPQLTPTVTAVEPGTVRIGWTGAWDRDNDLLTYQVLRGNAVNTSTVLRTFTQDQSNWWTRPELGFTDRTAAPGSNQTYRIRVTDPLGNTLVSAATTATIPTGAPPASPYAQAVNADQPVRSWRLGEATGVTALDTSGSEDLTLRTDAVRGVPGAITTDGDLATTFPGSTATNTVPAQPTFWNGGPETFSIEAWVNTTTTLGGQIIGFGDRATGRSSSNETDRNLYMSNDGTLRFGVRPDFGPRTALNSAPGFNDGVWHHVVGTLGADGMKLYVDGDLAASNDAVTQAQTYHGYWRIGGDRLSNWPGAPTREAINASLDEVAVYHKVLTPAQIEAHYAASGNDAGPSAQFTSLIDEWDVDFDGSSSSDPNGTIVDWAWNFGDGTVGTGETVSHTYALVGTYNVSLTVTDDELETDTTTVAINVTGPPPPNVDPTAAFGSTVSYRHVDFNGSTSGDIDGTVEDWAWDFGDGQFGTGATTSHDYGAAGTYPVTLTVTDDDGGTSSVTHDVIAVDPPAGYAADAFGRTVPSGLGSADLGGAWTVTGAATNYSVAGGVGRMTAATAGVTRKATLDSVLQTQTVVDTKVALSQAGSGGGAYVSVIGRQVGTNNDYRVKLRFNPNGTVTAVLSRTLAGAEANLQVINALPGINYVPGTSLRVKLSVTGTGTTTIAAKVWADGSTEPGAWALQTTDTSAALQQPGSVGALLYLSSASTLLPVVLSLDDFLAGPPA